MNGDCKQRFKPFNCVWEAIEDREMSINQPQIEKVNVLEAAEFDRKEFVMDQSPEDPEPSLLVLAPQEIICDQDSKGTQYALFGKHLQNLHQKM